MASAPAESLQTPIKKRHGFFPRELLPPKDSALAIIESTIERFEDNRGNVYHMFRIGNGERWILRHSSGLLLEPENESINDSLPLDLKEALAGIRQTPYIYAYRARIVDAVSLHSHVLSVISNRNTWNFVSRTFFRELPPQNGSTYATIEREIPPPSDLAGIRAFIGVDFAGQLSPTQIAVGEFVYETSRKNYKNTKYGQARLAARATRELLPIRKEDVIPFVGFFNIHNGGELFTVRLKRAVESL